MQIILKNKFGFIKSFVNWKVSYKNSGIISRKVKKIIEIRSRTKKWAERVSKFEEKIDINIGLKILRES